MFCMKRLRKVVHKCVKECYRCSSGRRLSAFVKFIYFFLNHERNLCLIGYVGMCITSIRVRDSVAIVKRVNDGTVSLSRTLLFAIHVLTNSAMA